MSEFITYAGTGGITADTPTELHVGNPDSVALTIGPIENITLEYADVEALERLRDLAAEVRTHDGQSWLPRSPMSSGRAS